MPLKMTLHSLAAATTCSRAISGGPGSTASASDTNLGPLLDDVQVQRNDLGREVVQLVVVGTKLDMVLAPHGADRDCAYAVERAGGGVDLAHVDVALAVQRLSIEVVIVDHVLQPAARRE